MGEGTAHTAGGWDSTDHSVTNVVEKDSITRDHTAANEIEMEETETDAVRNVTDNVTLVPETDPHAVLKLQMQQMHSEIGATLTGIIATVTDTEKSDDGKAAP